MLKCGPEAVLYKSLFRIIQRCWAHILRDAEKVCIEFKDNSESKKRYTALHRKLQNILDRAKAIAAKTAPSGGADMETCNKLAEEVKEIADEYGELKFATTLLNAADNLFTFLRYPGMPHTNNGPRSISATGLYFNARYGKSLSQ